MDVVFWDDTYVELLITTNFIVNLNWIGFISTMVANVAFTYKSLYLKSNGKIFLEECNGKNVFNLFKLNSF